MRSDINSKSKIVRIFSIILNCIFQTSVILTRWIYFNYNFLKIKKRNRVQNVDVLFSSYLINWRNYIHSNGKFYDNDLMIGDVVEETEKQYSIYCLDVNEKIRSISLTNKKFGQSNKWICFEEFISLKIIIKANLHYMKLSLGYSNHRNIDRFFSIVGRKPSITGYVYLLMADDIISEFNPKIVFITCEYCFFHRELSYISRLRGRKTIVLQHGELDSNGHFFFDTSKRLVIPDITCLFGKEYYHALTKKSIYTPDMLAVTGNPRYDVLYFADKIYSKQKLMQKYKLNPKKKVILWTTQSHVLTEKENRTNIEEIYSIMRSIPNAQLVIKLHPLEDQNHPLYNRNTSYKPIIIGREGDTNSLIYLSDIVITRHSTTGLEAVALKKHLIILNLSGDPDQSEYVNEGVAIGVYRQKELKPAIVKLLQENIELNKNWKKYIGKYLHRLDGKATQRVVRIIQEQLKQLN